MKKRIVALCVLAALLALALPWSLAAPVYEEVYLVGVNDTVLLGLINAELMPVRRSGNIYVPYTVMDNKDLELSYALNRTQGTFTVFNRRDSLIFQLDGSGSVDRAGNEQDGRIITRNGVVFIPLRFVSEFFGLSYSFYNLALPEGSVPIARVCTDRASLGYQQFSAAAAALVATPLRQYAESQNPPTPSAAPTAGPTPGPEPSAQPGPVDICFAVRCTDGAGFQSLLNSFDSVGCSALFLFRPGDLAARDADVRAAAAAGHQIGLLLPGEEPEAAFRRGNELLGHILRAQATQVAFPEGGAAEGDWWVWNGNVSPRGSGARRQAANLAEDVDKRTTARVTLTDSTSNAQALRTNITAWSRRPYTIFTPTETE